MHYRGTQCHAHAGATSPAIANPLLLPTLTSAVAVPSLAAGVAEFLIFFIYLFFIVFNLIVDLLFVMNHVNRIDEQI